MSIICDKVNEMQSYDNPLYYNLIQQLVIKGSQIIISPYANNHVMYLFIVTIKDPENKNRIICKVGYTFDIVGRINSLRTEYKCDFYLIALKFIENIKQVNEFHKLIKTQYKSLPLLMAIGKKQKSGIYIFDKILYNEFMKITESTHMIQSNTIINDDLLWITKNQSIYFQSFLKNQFESHILNVLTMTPNINEKHIEIMKFYIRKICHIHTREIHMFEKQLSIDNKREERKYQIQLKEMEIELEKLKKMK